MTILAVNFSLVVDTFTKDLICSAEWLGLIPSLFVCIPDCAVWDIRLMTLAFSGRSSVPPNQVQTPPCVLWYKIPPKTSWGELLPNRVPPAELYLRAQRNRKSQGHWLQIFYGLRPGSGICGKLEEFTDPSGLWSLLQC